jgi:hypothetical protein
MRRLRKLKPWEDNLETDRTRNHVGSPWFTRTTPGVAMAVKQVLRE